MKIKQFKKDRASLPKKSHLPDSGLDVFMPSPLTIEPLETKTIGLNLAVSIPEGHAGMLVPRSSIAQRGLLIQTSIIDPDYIGEIHLIITNCSNKTQTLQIGDRACSLVVYSVLNPYIELVDELEITHRGTSGLGSSGR